MSGIVVVGVLWFAGCSSDEVPPPAMGAGGRASVSGTPAGHAGAGAGGRNDALPDGGFAGTAEFQSGGVGGAQYECSDDGQCESKFCDRGECATVNTEKAYGADCIPPLFGPYGTVAGKQNSCAVYLCLDMRCRSCESDADCLENAGQPWCVEDPNRPGRRCTSTQSGQATIVLPPPDPQIGSPVALAAEATCAASELLLSFPVDGPALNGARLGLIWWHQRAGEPDDFMQIAYDVPLEPADGLIAVALSDVAEPFSENVICSRACRDPSECPCEATPQIALASLVVAVDRDGDGHLSLEEVREEQLGTANAWVGYAVQTDLPLEWTGSFEHLELGMCAYIPGELGPLMAMKDEQVVPLELCAPGDKGCLLGVRDLFCHLDCERDRGLNRLGL